MHHMLSECISCIRRIRELPDEFSGRRVSVRPGMSAGTEMPVVAMQEWAAMVLERTGLQPVDACTVADSLMFAESRGITTHGLLRLSTYVDRIAAGGINS